MTIAINDIKELRQMTGAGMMDCKSALNACEGNQEKAIDWLRAKGLSKAAKKAERIATEGLVGLSLSENGRKAVLVEVNAETDFVARNEQFQQMVDDVANIALLTSGNLDEVMKSNISPKNKKIKGSIKVEDYIKEMVGVIGESIKLRRVGLLELPQDKQGIIGTYIHSKTTSRAGRIAVLVLLLVVLESDAPKGNVPKESLEILGKHLAMQIAATSPLAVRVDELDEQIVEREREILREKARATNKPDNIIEKMLLGQMNRYYETVVLEAQTSIIDGETKISKLLETESKKLGSEIKIGGFVRFALGEGIEKKETDFAAEVLETATKSPPNQTDQTS